MMIKAAIRRSPAYHYFHVARRAGLWHLLRRERIVRRTGRLAAYVTRPVDPGASPNPIEVHMLVRRQDVRMALWGLHSFYASAATDWPLVLHQGGPMRTQDWGILLRHFPNAHCLPAAQSDDRVESMLLDRNMPAVISARRQGATMRKLIDPLLLSTSDALLVLDTDVLFFRRPDELLKAVRSQVRTSYFNRDPLEYPFNLSAEDARTKFGLDIARHLNSGIALFDRHRIPLDRIETYCREPLVNTTPHFTEQTLHGLLAAEFGYALLPDTYLCTQKAGLLTADGEPVVAKHYIETPRPLFFEEGIPRLLEGVGP